MNTCTYDTFGVSVIG